MTKSRLLIIAEHTTETELTQNMKFLRTVASHWFRDIFSTSVETQSP